MNKFVASLIVALAAVAAASGTDYYQHGQHYYQHGSSVPYYRQSHYHAGYNYYQGGYNYYQPAYETYSYYPVPNYVAPAAPAAQQDKWAVLAKAIADKREHEAFAQALLASGLSTPNVNYGHFQSLNFGAFGSNANSVYGYAQNNAASSNYSADLFDKIDLNVLFQQHGRGLDSAAKMFADARAGTQELTSQATAAAASLADRRARVDGAVRILQTTLQNMDQPKTTITAQKVEFGSKVSAEVDPKKAVEVLWQQSAVVDCASCHGGKGADGKLVVKGGYNVYQTPAMSQPEKDAVLARVNSSDPKERMPKDKDALSPEKRKVWNQYLSQ